MAEVWGNAVRNAPNGNYWQVWLTVEQTSVTEDKVWFRVTGHVYTRYSHRVYSNGDIRDSSDGYKSYNGSLRQGNNANTVFASYDNWFARSDSGDRTITFSARYQVTGGYNNGTSTCSLTMTVPAKDYKVPPAPTAAAVARSSDALMRLSWANNPDGTRGRYDALYVERETDAGGFAQIAKLAGTVANYDDRTTASDHRYRYRVRAGNKAGYSGYAMTGYAYTTPAAPSSVEVQRVGDGSSVRVGATGGRWAEAYDVERDEGAGYAAVASGVQLPYTDSIGEKKVRYRVRAVVAGLSGPWAESAQIAVNAPPNAPSVTGPAGTVAVGSAERLAWVPNHPDASAQSAAQVEYSVGGSSSTADVAGDATSWEFPASALAAPAEVRYRVRTKGVNPGWGDWSAWGAFSVKQGPTVAVVYPPRDGYEVGKVPVPVEWEASDPEGVAHQALALRGATGELLHSAELAGDARSYDLGAATYLPANLQSFTLEISVDGGSGLRARAVRAFSMDYAEPAIPKAEVTYGEGFSASVTLAFGADGWVLEGTTLVSPEDNADDKGVPITAGAGATELPGVLELGEVAASVSATVVRLMPDGSQAEVAGALADGGTALDPLPPLNTGFSYLVTVYSETGTATTKEVYAYVDSGGMEAYNFGAGAAAFAALGLDASASEAVALSGETFHFALGKGAPALPTFYPDGDLDVSGSHSYVLTSLDEYLALRGLVRDPANALCWYRSGFGRRAYGYATWTLSYAAGSYSLWKVSVKFTECVWEEPDGR